MSGLEAHLRAAVGLRLPGGYVALRLGGAAVGYVRPTVAARLAGLGLARLGAALEVADTAGLRACEAALAQAGVFRLRGEDFDVRAAADGAVLGRVDRGALPVFGIEAQGVHVNGLVRGAEGDVRVWVARRSGAKALDAGKLDHMVAGGICAGMDAAGTLVKEAAEEAGVPAAMARGARFVGMLAYAIERPEGLRRDRLHCYDLEVPAGFRPEPRDGEVESFALVPVGEVLARVRDTADYKFNVSLVLIDLFARLGLVDGGPLLAALRA
jgi:8-oxo-dGTP pyrophosphatase MutT (NUDIX family)